MTRDQRDLRDLFAAAGAEERAAADPLDVAALLGRAHRRRAVRGTTYSAIGLGTAAAIVLGAVSADGLWRDDEPPAPPATETTAPSPSGTPTAEPAEVATPTPGAFAPDWSACGQTTGMDDWFLQEESNVWLDLADDGVTPADRPLSLEAALRSVDPVSDARLHLVSSFALALGDDGLGTLVGVGAAPLDVEVAGDLGPDAGPAVPPTQIAIASCAASPANGGDGALDQGLDPAGYYLVGVVAELTRADGTTATFSLYAGAVGTEPVTDGPVSDPGSAGDGWTIRETLGGSAEAVQIDSPVRLPAGWGGHTEDDAMYNGEMESLCGTRSTPWPPQWLATTGEMNNRTPLPPAGVGNPFSVAATGFRDGSELVVRVTTTNVGTAVSDAWIASPGVTVVKDGRIIGWRNMWNHAYAPATWATGQTVQLEFPLGQFTCTFMQGEPWPAGTYEIYVQQTMDVLPQTGYATRWSYGAEGGPFTFTLD